jgi:hypothetical protein
MVKLIPFGGYCAMEGEDDTSTDEKAFCNKAAWRRFLIVIMGAVFNLIFGLIIVGITLLPQVAYPSTVVAEFSETATSNGDNGLMLGDEIIKIDKSITQNSVTDTGFKILKNIIQTSKDIGYKTLCEGIETKEQEDAAIKAGCDLLQGFYYYRPMSVATLESLFDNTLGGN